MVEEASVIPLLFSDNIFSFYQLSLLVFAIDRSLPLDENDIQNEQIKKTRLMNEYIHGVFNNTISLLKIY